MARRLALITGASAGIGAAFARIYASHGYDVALTARRLDRLEALAAEIRMRFGVEAYAISADLADPGGVDVVLAAIAAEGREIDALVNNAGYGLPGTYDQTSWTDQSAFLQVMLTSVCALTHKVLPGMVERRFGRIVNVASLAGLVPGAAGHTLYAATKSFLVKFSQSLHLENLANGVHVSALCPGFTLSEFHDVNGTRAQVSQSLPAWMWLGADEVAAAGYEAAEANRPVCVTGAPNKAIAVLAKIIPDEWALALIANQGGKFRKV
ncbi:SDR family NAD(P)-dependent oxidoreductase [Caulobacter endophyticus]|uniref:Dehydrogenase n=1 Tax=Caulobacter endophyticus TaxID=2172652 RepID=A0A2T9K0M0_9CAUL|nr:SDR family oxidoreductase [Caulobacter endophyticus]PVM89542.1 dehydrogenase [Caulobacter endophyticus]